MNSTISFPATGCAETLSAIKQGIVVFDSLKRVPLLMIVISKENTHIMVNSTVVVRTASVSREDQNAD
jgi:hypothetical protein